jgi:hypothetical protein
VLEFYEEKISRILIGLGPIRASIGRRRVGELYEQSRFDYRFKHRFWESYRRGDGPARL